MCVCATSAPKCCFLIILGYHLLRFTQNRQWIPSTEVHNVCIMDIPCMEAQKMFSISIYVICYTPLFLMTRTVFAFPFLFLPQFLFLLFFSFTLLTVSIIFGLRMLAEHLWRYLSILWHYLRQYMNLVWHCHQKMYRIIRDISTSYILHPTFEFSQESRFDVLIRKIVCSNSIKKKPECVLGLVTQPLFDFDAHTIFNRSVFQFHPNTSICIEFFTNLFR